MPTARALAALALLAAPAQPLAPAAAPPAAAAPARPSPGEALAARLIAALGAGDPAALLAFAEADCAPTVPAAQRAERMGGLAQRGAPFRLVRVVAQDARAVRFLVEDKAGVGLGFILDLTGPQDAPKLAALRVGPPGMLDEPAPKDHAGWTEPGALAAAIASDTRSPALGLAFIEGGQLRVAVSGVREQGKPAAVGADEPWSVGSIGKSICGSIIGRLVEGGKLRFETTLGEAYAGTPMHDGYATVTLEQLLRHRGGAPQDLGMDRARVESLAGGETDPVKLRERYARDVLGRAPIGRPGERFAYSNAGYALLAHLAEVKTGKPYEQLVRELVFAPLGLAHSFAGTATLPAARPTGHVAGPEGLVPREMGGPIETFFAGAGGGIWMSIGDLARYGEAHLAGLRGKDGFLAAATVQRLHRGEAEGPGQGSYAAGWSIHGAPGVEEWHGHNGSNGTFRAELAIFPKAGLVVAAAVNRGGESDPSPPLQAVLAVARRFAPGPPAGRGPG